MIIDSILKDSIKGAVYTLRGNKCLYKKLILNSYFRFWSSHLNGDIEKTSAPFIEAEAERTLPRTKVCKQN